MSASEYLEHDRRIRKLEQLVDKLVSVAAEAEAKAERAIAALAARNRDALKNK
jgi:acyl-homoserine lactone acylase PvdQ